VVHGDPVLEDSLPQLVDLPNEAFLKSEGETRIDFNALKVDWFKMLTTEPFDQQQGLFEMLSNHSAYTVNPNSCWIKDHLKLFRLAGLIVARAVIDTVQLPFCLTMALLKHLLGTPVSPRDLQHFESLPHWSRGRSERIGT
jgi:hypothetical protein